MKFLIKIKKIFKKKKKGFSLIELMVTIGIIGLLSVISIVTVSNVRASGRDAKRMSDMKQLATALDMYSIDNGTYPICNGFSRDAGSEWYTCLATALSAYISPIPEDPMGSESYGYYYYSINDGKAAFLYFGLEKDRPNMGNASFGWYNSYYGVYVYGRQLGGY